ncbi:CBO0543 family protein [Heyndrickxia sp. NPDC080065]|uniref:CBO0543 family protein n=1 Tax=Heyndrickxia sp. NPDC080065 TaxID=3390568 RepID=UPI003D06A799
MNTAKHLKESSSLQLRKKQFPFWNKNLIPPLLLGTLLGTYLDLFFIGKGLYSFPKRLMPEIFSINILFTLIGLPLFIIFFLFVCKKIHGVKMTGFIFILSLLMTVAEKFAETLGFFVHNDSWKHIYSLGGYALYLTIIYSFYRWSA